MILPASYAITLLILVISMICWGSWANTLKKSNWRFELFYFDYAIGTVLAATIFAFTAGSMGTEITVSDNFLLAAKKPILWAFVAGVIFNLANMLLVAAIDLAGMSVAFPVGIGLALIVGVVWSFVLQQVGNPYFLFGGCLFVLIAIILNAMALGKMSAIRAKAAKLAAEAAAAAAAEMAPAAATTTGASAAAKKKKAETKSSEPSAFRGFWIALAAGLLMGSFYPLVGFSMEGEMGLQNPYAVALVFSGGIFLSTFVFNLYFMNLPVKGQPISPFAYFTGTVGQHVLGLLGGMIWMTGAVLNFAGAAAQGEAKVGPAVSYGLGQGATFVSLLWGLLVWKEFAGADGGTRRLLWMMSLLFLAGLALVAIAPLR
jgi:glucose uptake protein